ncbi:hypothetical protein GCK32_021596, partial [Trichostrongylus colubriformis]
FVREDKSKPKKVEKPKDRQLALQPVKSTASLDKVDSKELVSLESKQSKEDIRIKGADSKELGSLESKQSKEDIRIKGGADKLLSGEEIRSKEGNMKGQSKDDNKEN